MSYLRYQFIQVGDTFKAEQETFHFHRGMTYTVSHVFNDNGKFRFFITDKYGNDVEYREYHFSPTAKTVTASEQRQMRSRLDFFWDNNEAPFVINKSWHYNFEETEFFDFENRAHFCGEGMEGVKARISRYKKQKAETGWRHFPIEGSKKLIYNKQDYYDYFKGLDMGKVMINAFYSDVQASVDHLQFMLSVPHFDESLLKIPAFLDMTDINHFIQLNKLDIHGFLKVVGEVIFDEYTLSADNKKIVYNVIEAYELLPNSFGPTGAAKLIMGKEKKKNKNVEHLSGTCTTLKQPQAFTLCDIVETFMYMNKIFVRTDDYSNGTEWRGDYEFIGSKMINQDDLIKIKNELK